ncbi:uncharacterized protein LOC129720319 [Wyeomyia smithii]|uniref:uncharacterized protein LOC129720319 n=1 Tax=Wyeomyia smithii TaxID=174621 RepID=UPI002467C086|nr:uncharacterized protein LOC129720319 [Wyeomyia smithii]
MKVLDSLIGLSALLLMQPQLSFGQNFCGITLGSNTVATKCLQDSNNQLTVCINDDKSFVVTCDDGKFCTENTKAGTASCESDGQADTGAVTCTSSGIFPDPKNCAKYHYCPSAGRPSWVQECPTNYTFYYTSTSTGVFPCKAIKVESDCMVVNCSATSEHKPYGTSEIFYGDCKADGSITISRCSNGAAFNETECVYACTKEGRFPDSTNSAVYYECYYLNSRLVSAKRNCADNKTFDAVALVCK